MEDIADFRIGVVLYDSQAVFPLEEATSQFLGAGSPDPATAIDVYLYGSTAAGVAVRLGAGGDAATAGRVFALAPLGGGDVVDAAAVLAADPRAPDALLFLAATSAAAIDSIRNAAALLASRPDLAFVYPDTVSSAEGWKCDMPADSRFWYEALMGNIQLDGILVRTGFLACLPGNRELDRGRHAGAFFTEMATAGGRGAQVPDFTIITRVWSEYRPAAEREERQRHRLGILRPWLRDNYSPAAFQRVEHHVFPRLALYIPEEDKVHLVTDPLLDGEILSSQEFVDRLALMVVDAPYQGYCPLHFAVMTGDCRTLLRDNGCLSWVIWRLIDNLKYHPVVRLHVESSEDKNLSVSEVRGKQPPGLSGPGDIVMTKIPFLIEIAISRRPLWFINELFATGPTVNEYRMVLHLPYLPPRTGDERFPGDLPDSNATHTVRLLLRMIEGFKATEHPIDGHAFDRVRRSFHLFESLAHEVHVGHVGFPMVPHEDRLRGDIAFVLPIYSFGGVERVALCLAREMRRLGWRVNLFVLNDFRIWNLPEAAEVFHRIAFLPDCGTRGNPNWNHDGDHAQAMEFLAGMDVVINCHAAELQPLAERLSHLGVRMLAHLHLLGVHDHGEPVGHPYHVLGTANSYDGFLSISRQLGHWMRGMGVAVERIVHVPNAASYELDQDVVDRVLAARWVRPDSPLRVLYIGRLDAQKGLDRLSRLYRSLSALQAPLEWRIVGDSVLENDDARLDLEPLLPLILPATHDPLVMTEHFSWADVIIMTSHYEGVPLVLIEAMRLGVVPVVTDVGAILELVHDGVAGHLVANGGIDQVVEELGARLLSLATDRSSLRRLAANAVAVVQRECRWAISAQHVDTFLCTADQPFPVRKSP